jgi:DNA-binding GntR family transcriptional regulator
MTVPFSRPEFVYDELRTLIIQGRMAPGARIIEQEVAARLGVSRTPVRAALTRLHQDGLLIANPTGTGTTTRLAIAPLTEEDGREVFQLMGALEGLAAREAAALDRQDRLRLADELKVLNGEFRRAAERRRGSHGSSVDLDAEFHRQLMNAAGGTRLRAMHTALHPHAERYERAYLITLTDTLDQIEEDHLAIVRAIRDGDAADAQRAAASHWRNAADTLQWAMHVSGERGNY